jgi:hypothetical protein
MSNYNNKNQHLKNLRNIKFVAYLATFFACFLNKTNMSLLHFKITLAT